MYLFYYLYIIIRYIHAEYLQSTMIQASTHGGQGNIRNIENNNSIRTKANEFE